MDSQPQAQMNRYTATFFTHFAAQASFRKLCGGRIKARMCPVPRSLSSSCGTCVRYEAEEPARELLHRDAEAVYLEGETGEYVLLWKNDS